MRTVNLVLIFNLSLSTYSLLDGESDGFGLLSYFNFCYQFFLKFIVENKFLKLKKFSMLHLDKKKSNVVFIFFT